METVASLVNPWESEFARKLWGELKEICESSGVLLAPQPHFTWQAAEAYDEDVIESVLGSIAGQLSPFKVRVSGLGLFAGENPVLYLALVKDRQLLEIHEWIWSEVLPYGRNQSIYYSPDQWVPHITLFYQGMSLDNLSYIVKNLAQARLQYEIQVDNLALLYSIENRAGIRYRYPLSPKSREEEP